MSFLFGSEGTQAQNVTSKKSDAERQMLAQAGYSGSQGLQDILAKYGSGGMSLQDALSAGQGQKSGPYAYNQAAKNMELATNPLSGRRFSEDQVSGSGMGKMLYGQGGLGERMNTEEQDLSTRGYNLDASDQDALGQAMGNVTRASGAQGNDLANMLAERGMGNSGAAGVAFSGLAGNKFEQLANAQQNIANARVQRNQERLSQIRNQMMGLGQQNEQAIGNQYGRNLAGRNASEGQLQNAVNLQRANRGEQQAQLNQGFAQKDATSSGGLLGDAVSGLFGAAAGGAGAGIGQAAGGGLQDWLGGGKVKYGSGTTWDDNPNVPPGGFSNQLQMPKFTF